MPKYIKEKEKEYKDTFGVRPRSLATAPDSALKLLIIFCRSVYPFALWLSVIQRGQSSGFLNDKGFPSVHIIHRCLLACFTDTEICIARAEAPESFAKRQPLDPSASGPWCGSIKSLSGRDAQESAFPTTLES